MSAVTDGGTSVRFGSFELDVRSRELRRGATTVSRLQEQPFEILRMMLERPGDVVTREELQQRLWPDGTYVDFEHSLNAAVKRLRAALGDYASNPILVETLPGVGTGSSVLTMPIPVVPHRRRWDAAAGEACGAAVRQFE